LIIDRELKDFGDDFEFLDLLEVDGGNFEDLGQQEKTLLLKFDVAIGAEQKH
jgi:hypothetical protein